MSQTVAITASYTFVSIHKEDLPALQAELKTFGLARGMRGLVLIATEGINSTVSGSAEVINEWKKLLTDKFGKIVFKDSAAPKEVFRRFSVKIKPEIVAIKKDSIHPAGSHRHISPQEWHEMMQQEDVVIIDARNSYEYSIGKFEKAIDPGTDSFYEFPKAIEKLNIPKDKKVMMYCTGGIRCEKAIYAMEEQGYQDVVQLDGGILNYLQQFPEGKFEGECFVFDHRVSVDGHLQPSQVYGLCPHCGDPGDTQISCFCGSSRKVCADCAKDDTQKTCSKRCRNELRKKAVLA